MSYDGFISYSHAADDLLAPRLQAGLQRFAKPWWQRRALRVFRDESSLSANPHLWSSITEALDTSGWFVLLLSPDAAQSEWVNQEVAYWVEHKDPTRILPVVTAGEFGWADGDVTGDAVPDALRGVFAEEPRWVDMRWAKEEDQLDLQDPRFADAVADIASAIRGVPKDDLASEEVKQHRRTVRTAWAAGAVVAVLAIAAVGFGIQSARNADEAEANAAEAERQARIAQQNADAEATARAEADANAEAATRSAALAQSRELAAAAVGLRADDPELSVLLALEALRAAPDGAEPPLEVEAALREAMYASPILHRESFGDDVASNVGASFALAPSGEELALTTSTLVRAIDTDSWEELWSFDLGEGTDHIFNAEYSPDGEVVAVTVHDARSFIFDVGADDDGIPARLVLLDAATGDALRSVEFPDCPAPIVAPEVFSPDGSLVASGVLDDGACLPGEEDWTVRLFDVDTLEVVGEVPAPRAPFVSWSADGSRMAVSEGAFVDLGRAIVYDTTAGYEVVSEVEGVNYAVLSPDGTRLVGSDAEFDLLVVDVESGSIEDRLAGLGDGAWGWDWSDDGETIWSGSDGPRAVSWDAASGELVTEIPAAGRVAWLEFDDARQRLYHGNTSGEISVWDVSGASEGELDTRRGEWQSQANSLSAAGDLGGFFVSPGGGGWFLQRFSAQARAPVGDPIAVTNPMAASPLPDGRYVFSRSDAQGRVGPVVAWDPETGGETELAGCWLDRRALGPEIGLATAEPAECLDRAGTSLPLQQVAMAPDQSALAVRLHTGETSIVSVPDLQTVEQIQLDEPIGLFGGEWFLVSEPGQATAFSIIDRRSLDVVAEFEESCGIQSWEVSHDGGTLAWATVCGDVHRVDTATWEDRQSVGRHGGRVRALAFSPDDTRLMTGAMDGLAKVWDLESGEETNRIPIDAVADGLWLSDDRIIITTADGLWTTVVLDLDSLVDLALTRVARSLTEGECAAYRIDPCPTLEELRGR